MPQFAYKALDHSGEVIRGFIEERDVDSAFESITSAGYQVLNIRRSGIIEEFYLKKLHGGRVKTKEIIEFANNLSVMLKAGIPLLTAIEDIADNINNKKFKSILMDIKNSVSLGAGFSASLTRHKGVFPEIFINLCAVGEETGRLDESLSDIALHLQRMEDLRSTIIRAMMYPVFALIATTGALLFWMIYVLPKISELFTSMNIELPGLTLGLIAVSEFTSKNWPIFIIIPTVIYIILKILSRYEGPRYYIDTIKLKFPVIGMIIYNKLLALFAEQLRILLAAGVTIDKAFDIMIKVVNHSVFRKTLQDAKENILLGSRINDALRKHSNLFPNIVTRMIAVGEATGNLTEQLDYLSEYFLNKLDDLSQKLGKIIEPIVIAVIGSMFLVIILGLLSPIYDLIGGIGK